jgi:hypothetical protein
MCHIAAHTLAIINVTGPRVAMHSACAKFVATLQPHTRTAGSQPAAKVAKAQKAAEPAEEGGGRGNALSRLPGMSEAASAQASSVAMACLCHASYCRLLNFLLPSCIDTALATFLLVARPGQHHHAQAVATGTGGTCLLTRLRHDLRQISWEVRQSLAKHSAPDLSRARVVPMIFVRNLYVELD